MGYSDMKHQVWQFMDYQSTNSAASLFHVNELLETFREVSTGVVTIEVSSSGKWLVITETTGGFLSCRNWIWDGRIFPDLGPAGARNS